MRHLRHHGAPVFEVGDDDHIVRYQRPGGICRQGRTRILLWQDVARQLGANTMSLIRDNAYGFHFFHSGKSFESFPSGHAAVIAAVMSVLWILHPRLRSLWAICVIAADIELVAVNIHFLSDVVAGSFVGVSTGLFTIAAWRASDHRYAERGRLLSSSGQVPRLHGSEGMT